MADGANKTAFDLKVQWTFRPSGGNAKSLRVLRVLELDGRKLADPLSLGAIRAILGNCTNLDTFRRGPGVFDLLDDDQVN